MKKSIKMLVSSFVLVAGLGFSSTAFSANTPDAHKEFSTAAPRTKIDQLKNSEIIHTSTGAKVTKKQMLDDIAKARVIYIGEDHDNIAAHKAQLEIIKDLFEKNPGQIAIGMEMFRRSAQPQLDQVKEGTLSLKDFNELFNKQWGAKVRPAYQDVLDYIYKKSIPVIGLKPTKEIEAIVRNGKTSPDVPDLDLNDQSHRSYFMPFFGGHNESQNNSEMAKKMYRMMVLWDEAMAERVAEFLNNPENNGKKLIVIAGTGHVGYGFGIPKRADRRMPHDYSIVIPTIDNAPGGNVPLPLGDYVWKVPYDKLEQAPQQTKTSFVKAPQP